MHPNAPSNHHLPQVLLFVPNSPSFFTVELNASTLTSWGHWQYEAKDDWATLVLAQWYRELEVGTSPFSLEASWGTDHISFIFLPLLPRVKAGSTHVCLMNGQSLSAVVLVVVVVIVSSFAPTLHRMLLSLGKDKLGDQWRWCPWQALKTGAHYFM